MIAADNLGAPIDEEALRYAEHWRRHAKRVETPVRDWEDILQRHAVPKEDGDGNGADAEL